MNSTQVDDRGVLVTCPKCGQRNRLKYDKLGGTGRCGKCGTELSAPGEPIEGGKRSRIRCLNRTFCSSRVGGFFGRHGAVRAGWSHPN
jgi:DNA-directed RNA polymerase subunit RPC12/RpoP